LGDVRLYENETHRAYLQKFLERVAPGGAVLSAGCGAGRYDGLLLDAGHPVVGIDSLRDAGAGAGALPTGELREDGAAEIDFREAFDGVICIDAMEHVSPEDYARNPVQVPGGAEAGWGAVFYDGPSRPGRVGGSLRAGQGQRSAGGTRRAGRRERCDLRAGQSIGSAGARALADAAVYHFIHRSTSARMDRPSRPGD